jgi:hypothetical protein
MVSRGEWVFAPVMNIEPEELEKAFGQKCLLSQHVWIEKVRANDVDSLGLYLPDIVAKPESQWGVYLSLPTRVDETWVSEQLIKVLITFDFLTARNLVQIPVAIWVRGRSRHIRTVLSHDIMDSRPEEMSHLKSELSEQHFRKTWQMLEKACSEDPGLMLGLERFTRGIRHSDVRDYILDLAIALESIIRASSEVTFRFSLYLSLISSDSAKEREAAYQDFKLLYELRCSVAHGDSKGLQKKVNKWKSSKQSIIKRARAAVWYYVQFLNLPGRAEWEDHLRGLALGTELLIGGD